MNTDDERAASRRRCGPQHAIAFVFVHVAFSLFAQPAFAVEPTGFLAASGPAPANSRGLYWRSAEQPLHDAELQIWDLESDVPTEVGVVRLPVTTGLGAKYEGIVRPTTGWSVGDRYRFVYRSGRSLQKVEVVVDAARVEAGDAAAVVTARVSTPFVRRAGDKCLSHCPDWDTSAGVSAVVVEIDLGPWEPFRSHLIVGVVDADDEARPHARLVDQERILLYRHCGVGRSDLPEAFWLSVTFPAASAQNTSKFGPIEVPDVCGSGPVIDAENWPAPETNVVLSSVATESTESTEAAAPQIQTTAIEHDPPVSQRETAASPANEPETGQVEWTLQVDPLTTLLGFVHLQVERRLGSHASVYLGPSLRLFSNPLGDPEDFVGYGGEMGVRYYFTPTAPRGWWVLGRGVLAHLRTRTNGNLETSVGGYVSALGGYTWIPGDWLVLSLGAGVQYLHYTVAGLGIEGILPAAHTTVGFAF